MVKISIDNTSVQADEGQSILAAIRQLGIDVPAMCCQDGQTPNTSCMCCLVRVDGAAGVVPSCATKVREGMRVESETDEIHELRRTGIELLLGDHAGDCHAPCENTCPARMDVPDMLRHVAEGDYRAAIETVKRDIALPAILGRVCPEVCENACRRGQHDSPAAICKLKQFVADRDLASASPYRPPIAAATGMRVAIVGGGPTGLTAAYHLSQRGHHCVLIEQHQQLGGRLRDEFSTDELPRDVLQSEAETALALDTEKRLGTQVGSRLSLDELASKFDAVAVDPACRAGFAQASLDDVAAEFDAVAVDPACQAGSAQASLDDVAAEFDAVAVDPACRAGFAQASLEDVAAEFDAVLLATGRSDTAWIKDSDIGTTTSGVRVDARTRMTSRDGVFAAGNAVRPYKLVVQSVAEGKLVAQCIDAWLRGVTLPDRRHKFETRLARLTAGELCDFCDGYPDTPGLDRSIPTDEITDEQARHEAERCLNCDCEALDSCLLHHYAAMYHCDAQRFKKGSGTVVQSTLRAVPATVPDPFLNHALRGSERRFEGRIVGDRVVLELGKCILCGICVQLAREAEDAVGLAFLGRSMETRIGPPPGVTLDQALGSAARRCAEACPTGAITLGRGVH